jgi:hypothetical protein
VRRTLDEFAELEVGKKYYMLTCTSVRPTVFRCDCGTEVRKRSLTHLNNGMRSCGCLSRTSRETRLDEKLAERKLELIDNTRGEKTRHTTWRVRCQRCGSVSTLSDTHLRFGRIGKKCAQCPRTLREKAANG